MFNFISVFYTNGFLVLFCPCTERRNQSRFWAAIECLLLQRRYFDWFRKRNPKSSSDYPTFWTKIQFWREYGKVLMVWPHPVNRSCFPVWNKQISQNFVFKTLFCSATAHVHSVPQLRRKEGILLAVTRRNTWLTPWLSFQSFKDVSIFPEPPSISTDNPTLPVFISL